MDEMKFTRKVTVRYCSFQTSPSSSREGEGNYLQNVIPMF